ncbi:MAG: hypothetical protein ACOYJG_10505 [Prevotella sp.]|jgi:hypothetical protein
MKKVFFIALAAVAITLGSCNGGNKPAQTNDNDSTAVDSASAAAPNLNKDLKTTFDNLTAQLSSSLQAKDNQGVISTLANLETIYKNLVDEGNVEEATQYGSAIKQFIQENSEELKTYTSGNTTIAELVNSISNLPTTAETTAEEAKNAVSSDVVNLASKAIASGSTTVATVEEAANLIKNAPETVKNAATSAAKNAAANAEQTVTNKANEAVDNAQKKASEKVNETTTKAANKVNDAANKAINKVFGN